MPRIFYVLFLSYDIIFIDNMFKHKRKSHMLENESYILPSPNDEMRNFINKFKIDMMEHVVSSIKFAIEHKLQIVEVFQFKNSPYVVTIAEKEFATNLDHIGKFYEENKIFELCPRVKQLQKLIQNNTNEKEKPETGNSYSDTNNE